MLDDKDEFSPVGAWIIYTCPGCGGYKQNGCETCSEYVYWQSIVEPELRKRSILGIIDNEELHAEVMMRMRT